MNQETPLDRDQDVVMLLSDVARLLRTEADRRARIHGLTRAQWVILHRVQNAPGLSQRELAEFLEVEPITVGRLVDRLEARGVVERRPDPDDRRIWRLHLRPAADEVLAELEDQLVLIRDLIGEGVDPDAMARTKEALRRMKSNLLTHRRSPAPTDDVAGGVSSLAPPARTALGRIA